MATNELSSCGEEGSELRRGPWTFEEDTKLIHYITCNGEGRWNLLANCSGRYMDHSYYNIDDFLHG